MRTHRDPRNAAIRETDASRMRVANALVSTINTGVGRWNRLRTTHSCRVSFVDRCRRGGDGRLAFIHVRGLARPGKGAARRVTKLETDSLFFLNSTDCTSAA